MRVLVLLTQLNYGAGPYFYLAQKLGADFEWVFATADPAVVGVCGAKGWGHVMIRDVSAPKPKPITNFLMRWPIIGGRVRAGWRAYAEQRVWAEQAAVLIEEAAPQVILTMGDYDGLEFHLGRRGVPMVVLQVMLKWVDLEREMAHIHQMQGRNGRIVRGLVGLLSRLSRRQILSRVGRFIYLPHGAEAWVSLGAWLGGLRYATPIKGGTAGDYVCVNGARFAETFAAGGVPSERIRVTGSPTHDQLLEIAQNFDAEAEKVFRADLDIPPHAPLIAYFLNPPDTYLERRGLIDYAGEVEQIAAQLSGLADDAWVVVKFHPIQNARKYADLQARLDQMPRVVQIKAEGHSDESFNIRLVAASRMMVLQASTTGFIGLALHVPLLIYAYQAQFASFYFQTLGGALHVDNPADFEAAARTLFEDENRRAALVEDGAGTRQNFMMLDGLCCARIGAVLREAGDGN